MWKQRQDLSDTWDQARAAAIVLLPNATRSTIDAVPGVVEAKFRYERSAEAVTALVDSITERVSSAEEAVAAQRLAKITTEWIYRQAVAANEAIIGGEASIRDATTEAQEAAAAGTIELGWTQNLVVEAQSLSDAAAKLGCHNATGLGHRGSMDDLPAGLLVSR